MSGFLLSPEADEDVWNIWRYLAEDTGVSAANRIEADLFRAFEVLAQTPGIGHRRPDLTSHPVSQGGIVSNSTVLPVAVVQ